MNKVKSFLLFIIICFIPVTMNAQQNLIAFLTVDAGNYDRYDTPVSVIIGELMDKPDLKDLLLYEVSGGERIRVNCQVEEGNPSKLWWIMNGYTPAGSTRYYEIYNKNETGKSESIKVFTQGFNQAVN